MKMFITVQKDDNTHYVHLRYLTDISARNNILYDQDGLPIWELYTDINMASHDPGFIYGMDLNADLAKYLNMAFGITRLTPYTPTDEELEQWQQFTKR